MAEPTTAAPDLATFADEARAWLDANAERKKFDDSGERAIVWGEGEFSVSVFHNLSFEEEKAIIDEAAAWTQKKAEVGYHKITWEPEFGGMGLSKDHEKVFQRLEAEYVTPGGHETHSVTTHLMAPTIRLLGTDQQKADWVRSWARADELCCQLFSEPGAGSDLASVATRADRDGDEWVLNGQKVWSSGAQFSPWGMAVCRSDSDLPKHKGITVFVMPMDAPGVEIRQIRQMSGGTSFNEVFLTDVRIPDAYRIGDVGEGWKVALTVLGFERGGDGSGGRVGGTWAQVKALADHFDAWSDPVLRDDLAKLYIQYRLMAMTRQRVASQVKAGQAPGPEGSIGKIFWTDSMRMMSDVVGRILGPRLTADSGEWGTYEWNDHVLGAPGYRIAGGSDEIQRNIVGERVLGLPGEPRVDKNVAFKDQPK
jgi:alkylation response protein AidB-like acyl-CoA dehydrogenase